MYLGALPGRAGSANEMVNHKAIVRVFVCGSVVKYYPDTCM